jgi:serine/threonine protein kinase
MESVDVVIADRYKVRSVLGVGGVGTTYAAWDILDGSDRLVALKELSLRQSQDWKIIELFEREAKTLAKLSHPHIPRYIDYFTTDTESDRHFYLVRELAAGESLADLVEKGWRSDENELRNIIIQVLEILIYLHELSPSVIHRDLKPSNLIYQPDSKQIFLIDFGAVQNAYSNTIMGCGTFVGTFGYMAPEQLRGETGVTADLYSLGMTLIYLLTHRAPSELPHKRMKIDLRSSNLGISDELLRWLDKIIEPIPEDRFPSARTALKSLQSGIINRLKKPKGSKIKLEKSRDRLFINTQNKANLGEICKANVGGISVGAIFLLILSLMIGALFNSMIVTLLIVVLCVSLNIAACLIFTLTRIEITINRHQSILLRKIIFGFQYYTKTGNLARMRRIVPLRRQQFNLTNVEINWLEAEINDFLDEDESYPIKVTIS